MSCPMCGQPKPPHQPVCFECATTRGAESEQVALEGLDRDGGPLEDASEEDMDRWARRYDDLNGAPESEEDR